MEKSQRWRDLCAQAAMEKDPNRLMELVAEISRLFDEEHARIHPSQGNEDPAPPTDEEDAKS